jgi:phosphohistidine swiveling domain-containing protein
VSLPQREALRLRARWVQELSARAAREIGRRLHAAERIGSPDDVAWFTFEDVDTAVTLGVTPRDWTASEPGPPLPAAFRLTPAGDVVAHRPRRKTGAGEGTGASAGHADGVVHHAGDGMPPKGAVLVVTTLDPDLATLLPRLGALVSETGSVLSHLAIMAREYGVPAVVGVTDAMTRFPAGARVSVDGTTGEVKLLDGDA